MLPALLLASGALAQCGVVINTFPYNEGFETAAAWTSGGFGDDWAWGTPAHPLINSAGGGVKSWCVGGLTGQFYTNSEQSWLMSPCFDFTSLSRPWISFKIFWEAERQYDGMVLQYSLNQGTTWTNVGAYGDPVDCLNANWFNENNVTNINLANPPNGWSGRVGATQGSCQGGFGSGGWMTAMHCMNQLAGEPSVRFRFLFGAGYTCNSYDGIAIDDIFIDNSAQPTADFDVACAGATATFTAAVTGCATIFHWDFGDPASGAQNAATGPSVQHVFSGPGSYSVTLDASNACGSAATHVETFDVISVQILSTSATCGAANGSLEAVVTGSNGPFTYDWEPGAGNASLFSGLLAGNYSVTVSSTSGCPVMVDGTVAAANSTLQVNVVHTDVSCGGAADGTATAQVSGGTPASYAWAPSGGNSATASGLSGGAYTVSVTDINGCTVTADVTIIEAPTLTLDAQPAVDLCAGSSVTLQAIAGGGVGPYAYDWSPDGPDVSPTTTTTYAVNVTDAAGCAAGPVNVTVNVGSAPVPTLSVDDPIGCTTHCAQFTAGPAGMSSYAFGYGDGASGLEPDHCYVTAGVYDVSLTITDANGCSGTVIMPGLVEALPSPVAGFVSPGVVIITDPPVRLIDQSTGAEVWSWAIHGLDTVGFSDEPSPLFTPVAAGCSGIQQIVTNSLGCADTARAEICVEDEFAIYAPNAFTPNGDGWNEGFHVVTSVAAPSRFELRIFDRWGELIFTASEPDQAWEGSGAPEGVYAWNLTMRDSKEKLHKASGHVLLMR